MASVTKDEELLAKGRHPDPFSILGPHTGALGHSVRAFLPGVDSVTLLLDNPSERLPLRRSRPDSDLFSITLPNMRTLDFYQFEISAGSNQWVIDDPYRFSPVLGELDEHLIGEGAHKTLWDALGAHPMRHQGVDGVHFAVWAPNATRVSVVGPFNQWDGRCSPMRRRGVSGVWEIFLPGLGEGQMYKYEIVDSHGQVLPNKADPVGFGAEHAPGTASVVRQLNDYVWADQSWISQRDSTHRLDQPLSIYEVHLGSWRRKLEEDNRQLSYHELASELVDYVTDLGFTHIELLPISEFPFDGSWGYQPTGLFAPTIRHGTLNEFRDFINICHQAGLGVLLDWVPGHFPEDPHGLGKFDGTSLYEHADRREGFHPDWQTLVYNYGRREVSNYLVANALYWLKEYHIDGLRIDAVASMLYRDYSRKDGEWIPNSYGGRENLEAIEFLKRVNLEAPAGTLTVAEESTTFPGVSSAVEHGGLGFDYKWNMGWMNDTLSYISKDPVHRKHHHHQMTFGLTYQYSERFVLPLSHDEVVHGKGSLMQRIPGNHQEKAATLRTYYGFMWGHPGKKLLFMGNEIAQTREWNHQTSLDWHLLEFPEHHGMQQLVKDLNHLYRQYPALYRRDHEPEGFQWLEVNAIEESLFAWVRYGRTSDAPVLVICNFTPIERTGTAIGVPHAGRWKEILNTDAAFYGGNDVGNLGITVSKPQSASGCENAITPVIPGLSTLMFVYAGS